MPAKNPKAYQKEWFARNKEWRMTQTTERNRAIKRQAVDYLGGSCEICGYSACMAALHFHHVNPEDKVAGIAELYGYSWDRVKQEVDKCILLCANCHAEVECGFTKVG